MTNDPLPTVSVVVPTCNRADSLPRMLAPLAADPATSELIVVVDGTDGSAALLRELAGQHPRLRVLHAGGRGGAAARQLGIDAARGEVVLLLDDDVLAQPGLVTGHARRHADAEHLVVLGSMPTRAPARLTPATLATALYAEEYDRVCARYANDPASVLRCLWGGNLSLRRADLVRVPYCTGIFGHANHSDRDFGLRCLAAGLTGTFDLELAAEHQHRRPASMFLRDAHRQGRGLQLLHQQHELVLGPLQPDVFGAGLPRPVAALVRATRRPSVRLVVTSLGRAALWPTLPHPMVSVQLALAKLLRRVELQRGAQVGGRPSPAPELVTAGGGGCAR